MRIGGQSHLPRMAFLVALMVPIPAAAATIEVTVQGVRNGRGEIRIGVCRQSEFLSEHCAHHAVVAARKGDVRVRIDGIEPGLYAVAVYQDLDGSGKLKRGFLGMPEEDLGFSRNPPLSLGPPEFARSALMIGNDDVAVALTLHHFGF